MPDIPTFTMKVICPIRISNRALPFPEVSHA